MDRSFGSELIEFTFFVDADAYLMAGSELDAEWDDLVDQGIERVDLPTGYAHDLGERIPVRVAASARGLRFYARLLHLRDELQLVDMERVIAAAQHRRPNP